MVSTISLTGINCDQGITLTGLKSKTCDEPIYIKRLKTTIYDLYILPLYKNNWSIINENMFRYDIILERLKKYNKITPTSDLQMYIKILEILAELNGQYWKQRGEEKIDGLARMEQTIPNIRLAPAYELYNLICGVPENKLYDDFKIAEINNLLNNENLSFNDIKNLIIC